MVDVSEGVEVASKVVGEDVDVVDVTSIVRSVLVADDVEAGKLGAAISKMGTSEKSSMNQYTSVRLTSIPLNSKRNVTGCAVVAV